jgi:hypothetical protein
MENKDHTINENEPKRVKVILMSAFGLQPELSASQRVISILKGFYLNNVKPCLIVPTIPKTNNKDIEFADVYLVRNGLIQKITYFILDVLKKILSHKGNGAEKKIKTAYSKGNAYLAIYTFFFYGKVILPLFKTYKLANKLIIRALESQDKPIVITASNPGSFHLIGYFLKKKYGRKIVWVADYHDPLEDDPILRFPSLFIYKYTNNKVFEFADKIASPSQQALNVIRETALKRNYLIDKKTYFLPLGIEQKVKCKITNKDWIIYGGTIYPERAPGLKALLEAIKKSRDFKFVYAGFTNEIVEEIINEVNLPKDKVKIFPLIEKPDFEKLLASCGVILILGTFGTKYKVLGSKIFEALAYDKPVLVIAPEDSDYFDIIKQAGGVYVADANSETILTVLEQIKADILIRKSFRNDDFFAKYSSKKIIDRFLKDLEKLYNRKL